LADEKQGPSLTQSPGLYRLEWAADQVIIEVRELRQHRDGRVTGKIEVKTTAPNCGPYLHGGDLNFGAPQSRRSLAKILGERYAKPNWERILEELCRDTLATFRKGEPAQSICTAEEFQPPEYLLWPFVLKDEPTVFFGEGESAKSLLALLFSIFIQLPWRDPELGLLARDLVTVTHVLYLDWEACREEVGWRLKCLRAGLKLPELELMYRRCSLALADDLPQIQEIVNEENIGCVVVDSLGGAAGGDLNTAEVALRFFAALRQLKVSSILIAHTAKDAQARRGRTIYGSAFFHNYARSVWYVKRASEQGENEIHVGLFHHKANNTPRIKDLGFRFSFNGQATHIEKEDPRSVSDLVQEVSGVVRVRDVLQHGALSVAEISDALELPENHVRTLLGRMKNKAQVIKTEEGKWGLRLNA